MLDWKMPDQMSGLENAGLENRGPWLIYSKCCVRVVYVTLHAKCQFVFWWLIITVIAILFYCNFLMLPVLWMTQFSHNDPMASYVYS